VLERCDVRRRDESADVLDGQCGLGRDAVRGEKVVERGSEELAIDEEFEGNGLLGGEQSIDQSRKLIAT